RLDVEADDDGVVHRCQVDVVLRDGTHTAVDDTELNVVVSDIDLEQGVFEGFHGTGDVTLEDEVEGVDLAFSNGLVKVFQADALATLGQCGVAVGSFTLLGDLAGRTLVRRHQEGVTCTRHVGQAEDLDRTRRQGAIDGLAFFVEHCGDAAVGRPCHDRVTHGQGTGLHQDGGHGTAALVQVRFDGNASSVLVRVGAQIQCGAGRTQA